MSRVYGHPQLCSRKSVRFRGKPACNDQWSHTCDNAVRVPRVPVRSTGADSIRHDTTRQVQPGTIGITAFHRQWLLLSAGDVVSVEPLDVRTLGNEIYLGSIDIDLGFWNKRLEIAEQFSADDITKTFIRQFNGCIFSPGQVVVFEYHGQNLRGDVRGVQVVELAAMQRKGAPAEPSGHGNQFGILIDQTDITFLKAEGSLIKLKSSAKKCVE